MRKILTGLCIILVLSVARLAHSEVVDTKQFGQCGVGTDVDDFTDEKSAQMFCLEKKDNNWAENGVALLCMQKTFIVGLKSGIQFHTDEMIDIAYRFDKGKLVTRHGAILERAQ